MTTLPLTIFPELEKGFQLKIRKWRDAMLRPLCQILARIGVTPDMVSYVAFSMVIFFVIFFSFNPWIACIFLALNILFDSLDGALARFSHRESVNGSLLDRGLDQFVFLIVFFCLFYFQLFQPFWAALYIVNYIILIFLTIILQSLRIHLFPILRTKYLVYLLFLMWLLGWNFFNLFFVFFGIYMLAINLFLFYKLRCSLS